MAVINGTSEVAAGATVARNAAVGGVWQALGFASVTLCGYVVAVILARRFGPAAFGIYGVVYSVLMASELILRLGVPQALTKLVGGSGSRDSSSFQAAGVTLTMLVTLTGFAVLWSLAPLLAEALNLQEGTRLFRIAILDLPFFALYTCLSHILNGRGEFRITGIVKIVYGFTRMWGVIVIAAAGAITIENALIVNILASIVGLAMLLPRVSPRIYRPSLATGSTIMALALPITLGEVGMQCLLAIDLWLLNALGTPDLADLRGDYVAAISVARMPNVMAFVLTAVLIPSIARALSSNDIATARRLVNGTVRLLILLVLPVCALIAANAGELMALMFSESYRPGGELLALLVFAQGFGYTFVSALLAILVGAGAIRIAASRIYLSLAVALALNLTLIPILSVKGAAISALISFVLATALVAQIVRRRVGSLVQLRTALLALLAAAAVGSLGWHIQSDGWLVLVECAALGLAYLFAIWGLQLIRAGDIAMFRKLPAEPSVAN